MTDPVATVEDELERALQLSLAVAAQSADRLARARLERQRHAQQLVDVDARRLEARVRAEGGAAVARLAAVDRTEWWNRADTAQITAMWELALEWRDVEPRAALAADTISRQIRARHRVDAPLLAAGDLRGTADGLSTGRPHSEVGSGEVAAAMLRAEQRDTVLAEAARSAPAGEAAGEYDTPHRRDRLAAEMRDAGLPVELIAAAMRADVAHARPFTAVPTVPATESDPTASVPEAVTRQVDRSR